MNNYIGMPDRTADLLIRFLRRNDGKLSERVRDQEFSALTDEGGSGIRKQARRDIWCLTGDKRRFRTKGITIKLQDVSEPAMLSAIAELNKEYASLNKALYSSPATQLMKPRKSRTS